MDTKVKIDRTGYIPGVCNIGKAERAQRKLTGWIGLAVTVILSAALIYFNAGSGWRLTVFIPAVYGASGFIQAYFHFCVNFGLRAVYNFDVQLRRTNSVQEKEFIKQDRKRAWQLISFSGLIALVATILVYLI